MKKRFAALLALLLLAGLLCGCGAAVPAPAATEPPTMILPTAAPAAAPGPTTTPTDAPVPEQSAAPSPTLAPTPTPAPTPSPTPEPTEEPASGVTEDGEYTAPEDVAEYLHLYGHLPGNFITKKEAQALGWDSSRNYVSDAAPGKSIGGDYFGNYEKLLPKGSYRECDVNYTGGRRGAERIIYGEDGSVWYTADHYQSFTQLY